jgi:acyl carrier protein
MDYLHLFNEIIKVATPLNTSKAKATSLDQPLADTGLDSLDLLMVSIYLAEIFGVSEEIAKEVKAKTVSDLINYMHFNRSKEPASVEEAIKAIQ